MKNPFGSFRSFYASKDVDNLYRLDGAVPMAKGFPFGVQHTLAMFVGNIAPILICYALIGANDAVTNNGLRSAIFIAALGTLIQLFPIWRIGSRLPIVSGTSFTFLGVLTLVGSRYGFGTMFVSVIVGGLLIGILGLFADKWSKFIKPIVSATVVLGLGLSLLSVGIKDFLSTDLAIVDGIYRFDIAWPYLIVAVITLFTGIAWQIFVKGVWKNLSILVGVVVGYVVALCFIPVNNMVDFSKFTFNSFTDFIDVPRPFFTLTSVDWSSFNIGAILTVFLIYVVMTTEVIGGISSLSASSLGREATKQEIRGGISSMGFVSALAGFFGSMPLTVYSQNVGITGQTKVVNRFAMLSVPIILFLASLFPPFTTFLMTIPAPVLGGTTLMLFASIAIIGMQMISGLGFTKKNIMILSLALGFGYAVTLVPAFTDESYVEGGWKYVMLILQNPVANMFIISLLLSYIIPDSINNDEKKKDDSEQSDQSPE